MSRKLRFEIYFNGTMMGLQWRNAEDFQRGTAFLEELVGGPANKSDLHDGRLPFYYFENKAQMDELLAFRKKLKAKNS